MSTSSHSSNSNYHRSTVTPIGTPTQACAACKYQRRRCNPDCALAPYFPADHQKQFLNAHRLFGVKKILNIIESLDPEYRPLAMHSIMFHSDARAHDPVGGCYQIILNYEHQMAREAAELDLVNRQLAICRQQPQQTAFSDNHISSVVQQQQQQQLYYYYYGKNVYKEERKPPPSSSLVMKGVQSQCENDDTKPFVELFDLVHQKYMAVEDQGDSKSSTSLHNSAKVELKEEPTNTRNDVQEHDLKGAASLFTLNEDPNSLEENVIQQEHDLKDAASSFTLNEEPTPMEQGQEPDLKSTTSFFSLKQSNTSEHVQEYDLKGAASFFTLTNFNTSTA